MNIKDEKVFDPITILKMESNKSCCSIAKEILKQMASHYENGVFGDSITSENIKIDKIGNYQDLIIIDMVEEITKGLVHEATLGLRIPGYRADFYFADRSAYLLDSASGKGQWSSDYIFDLKLLDSAIALSDCLWSSLEKYVEEDISRIYIVQWIEMLKIGIETIGDKQDSKIYFGVLKGETRTTFNVLAFSKVHGLISAVLSLKKLSFQKDQQQS